MPAIGAEDWVKGDFVSIPEAAPAIFQVGYREIVFLPNPQRQLWIFLSLYLSSNDDFVLCVQ
jgi:hypothetical protein